MEPTILLVTHDQHEAAVLADSVGVLLEGRIAQHGPLGELYAHPAELPVHAFLGGHNAVPGFLRGGVHRSALGHLALAPAVARPGGEAVLVLRPEVVGLTQIRD